MKNNNSIYCDTCVILSYFKRTEDRIAIIDTCFDNISNNKDELLITSTITKIEISWIESIDYDLSLSDDDLIVLDDFWNDSSLIELIELNESIVDISRDIMRHARKNTMRMKTMDSIHLGTAKWANSQKAMTYDEGLFPFAKYLGIEISTPNPGQLTINFDETKTT